MFVMKWCITAMVDIQQARRHIYRTDQRSTGRRDPDFLRSHGVSQAVRNEAKSRDLTVFDATCPLVTKVHMEVARASRRGEESILTAMPDTPEVEGIHGSTITRKGGMYLVESPEDVLALEVKNDARLSFMTW